MRVTGENIIHLVAVVVVFLHFVIRVHFHFHFHFCLWTQEKNFNMPNNKLIKLTTLDEFHFPFIFFLLFFALASFFLFYVFQFYFVCVYVFLSTFMVAIETNGQTVRQTDRKADYSRGIKSR